MARKKKTDAPEAADAVEQTPNLPDIPEEPTDIPKAEQTATAPEPDPDGVENPTPEAQDPTPEAFTPYQAEVIPALLVVRKEPDGPAVATLTHGAVIRVTGRQDGYAQMENGLYVREGMIRPTEPPKT